MDFSRFYLCYMSASTVISSVETPMLPADIFKILISLNDIKVKIKSETEEILYKQCKEEIHQAINMGYDNACKVFNDIIVEYKNDVISANDFISIYSEIKKYISFVKNVDNKYEYILFFMNLLNSLLTFNIYNSDFNVKNTIKDIKTLINQLNKFCIVKDSSNLIRLHKLYNRFQDLIEKSNSTIGYIQYKEYRKIYKELVELFNEINYTPGILSFVYTFLYELENVKVANFNCSLGDNVYFMIDNHFDISKYNYEKMLYVISLLLDRYNYSDDENYNTYTK